MPKAKEIASWRKSHFKELEKSMQVAISIRDSEATSIGAQKNKIEAIKVIGRLLGALQPEKVSDSRTKEEKLDTLRPTMSAELKEKLARLKTNGMEQPSTELVQ